MDADAPEDNSEIVVVGRGPSPKRAHRPAGPEIEQPACEVVRKIASEWRQVAWPVVAPTYTRCQKCFETDG